ncbi:response regulator [Paraburkholderia sp. EG304]|uniref:response regulator n=1 Tax=Paraburkholderia sp. EG304 TaxID=3237015 RepID=UPI00397C54F3
MRSPQVIWVVDDDPSFRSGLSSLLRSLDYVVLTFESGADLIARTGETQPDCIISDVQMPGMSGFELTLRLIETGRSIPTVFVSAYPKPELQQEALATGACAFLTKPLSAKELTAAIEAVTSTRSS